MAVKTNYEKNGKKYFRITRTIGKKADGTPIKKEFYGNSKSDAEEKADKYLQDLKSGLFSDNQIITINILLPKWLFSIKINELKQSSFESYESLYRNYIKDNIIANLPINELRSIKIQEYYNKLIKNKTTANNIKKINKLLRQFFAYAEKEGYIIKNPCSNISLPKSNLKANTIIESKKTNFSYFDEKEIKVLKKAFNGNKYEDIVLFALGTGMRQGEILALKWENIDFEAKEIHVVNTLNRSAKITKNDNKEYTTKREYETKITEPKTQNSIRIIPISTGILNILNKIPHESEFVFSVNGSYIDAKDLQKTWKKVLLKNNIPYRKFHDLRHTFATMLLSHGANLITVKELLGHSSIKITEIYLDALPKTKIENLESINFIFN